MPSTLTTRERAHLKARAHALEPVVHVGQSGITQAIVTETDRALTAHELIKVRIGGNDRHERVSLGTELASRTDATAVYRVSNMLILWRPRPQDLDR